MPDAPVTPDPGLKAGRRRTPPKWRRKGFSGHETASIAPTATGLAAQANHLKAIRDAMVDAAKVSACQTTSQTRFFRTFGAGWIGLNGADRTVTSQHQQPKHGLAKLVYIGAHDSQKAKLHQKCGRTQNCTPIHTYRGRQGADVAMLVRRIRDRINQTSFASGLALLWPPRARQQTGAGRLLMSPRAYLAQRSSPRM